MLLKIEGIDKAAALFALYQWANNAAHAMAEQAVVDAKNTLVERDKELKAAIKREEEAVKSNAPDLMAVQDARERAESDCAEAEVELQRCEQAAQVNLPELSEDKAKEVVVQTKGSIEAVNFLMIGINLRGDLINTERFDGIWGEGGALGALKALGAKEQK